jgi:hypothetical protein
MVKNRLNVIGISKICVCMSSPGYMANYLVNNNTNLFCFI